MTTDKYIEALKLALENICAAKLCEINSMSSRHEMIRLMDEAITVLREALAEQPAQQQEAQIVRWKCPCGNEVTFRGFTEAPASKPWVGLTDEEIKRMAAPWFLSMYWPLCNTFARAIEAKLREKNEPREKNA